MVASKIWFIFIHIGLFVILVGCSSANSEITTPDPANDKDGMMGEEDLYSANEGGQIIVQGDLMRIGVGAVRSGEYTDEEGQLQSGALAHLSFFVRDHPELEQDMDVHEGKIMTVAGYRVRVTEINIESNLVVVKIATPIDPLD